MALLCILFRVRPPDSSQSPDEALFQGLRVWTDILDACESESFGTSFPPYSEKPINFKLDGHRKVIVEHSLNILLLPGIHCEGTISHRAHASSDSLVSTHGSFMHLNKPFVTPSLAIPGTSLALPSPLHFKLRIITRLSFNEQGLVTHHRDIWDVKDVMGLVPGVSLAQWIGTRIAAVGLSYISSFLPRTKTDHEQSTTDPFLDVESGR